VLAHSFTVWCEPLYDFFYFRQWEAVVLSICIVPLSRVITVCWKNIAPSNAKVWVLVAIIPNILPLLIGMIGSSLGVTNSSEVYAFPRLAIKSYV
ncbi:hypothetical protein COOONC_02202, partial [Cooperia oncophora]